MPTDGERLATLEAVLLELRGDVGDLKAESGRARDRLHKLEGSVAAFMSAQTENRRQEKLQYQRLGTKIAKGGLAVSIGLLVLAAVTLWTHLG